jgi:hypothetical protein
VALDQSRFDQLLAELGPPLFRLHLRLRLADVRGAGEPAELLYPRFATRGGPAALAVCQAVMWSRLAAGQREAALEPYLRVWNLLQQGARLDDLPGTRRPQIDPASGLVAELSPLFFDRPQASLHWPQVEALVAQLPTPPEGLRLYAAALAAAAGQPEAAQRHMAEVHSPRMPVAGWKQVLLALTELDAGNTKAAAAQLASLRDPLPPACRGAALLVRGRIDTQSDDPRQVEEGLLELLTLPAAYASQSPELAAAGLYEAALAFAKLKEETEAAVVRRELATRWPASFHARQLGVNAGRPAPQAFPPQQEPRTTGGAGP